MIERIRVVALLIGIVLLALAGSADAVRAASAISSDTDTVEIPISSAESCDGEEDSRLRVGRLAIADRTSIAPLSDRLANGSIVIVRHFRPPMTRRL